ncbi:MAG TPA: ferritin-like domain-containing protein [Polyangia bacterium]|nr:ferritin-like domain-containing protein [Polyangia bacterium]
MGERFLEDHRRPIADYDRIQFDEREIAALRARLDLETPLRVHWNWDYLTEIESLRALYERGKSAQWNVETDLDWSLPMSEDEWLLPPDELPVTSILQMMGADERTCKRCAREEVEHTFSQLLHGEQAALHLTAQLVNAVGDVDTKLFAGQQVADECRHVEVFAKVIARKLSTVHPIDPNIKFLLDEMLAAENWRYKTIGMQVLFEGVAMAVITDIGQRTQNPLIRQIMKLVARDEARHAAFGALALREELPALPEAERNQLEDWTWKCLEVVANGLLIGDVDHVAPRYGLSVDAVAQAVFSSPAFWDARYHLFNHTVLPNLRRLGLITARTRPKYDRFRLWDPVAPFGSPPPPKEEFYGS